MFISIMYAILLLLGDTLKDIFGGGKKIEKKQSKMDSVLDIVFPTTIALSSFSFIYFLMGMD